MSYELLDLINDAFAFLMSEVHTAIPGKIESYDKDTRTAKVTPLVSRRLPDGTAQDLPAIVKVPVIFPGTADSVIHYPLPSGTGVLLIISERSIEKWQKGSGSPEAPDDPRRFSLSDAVAIAGLCPQGSPGKSVSGDGLEILHKSGKIVIANDGKVTINDNFEVST